MTIQGQVLQQFHFEKRIIASATVDVKSSSGGQSGWPGDDDKYLQMTARPVHTRINGNTATTVHHAGPARQREQELASQYVLAGAGNTLPVKAFSMYLMG